MSRIATVCYTSNLHSDLTHLQSGNVVNTDAPTNNDSIGEAFSPTDLFVASLDACMMTIMGMKATDLDAGLVDAHVEVVKEIAASSRRVAKVAVDFYLSKDLGERSRRLLEVAIHTCPVAQNLSAESVQELRFHYE